MEAGPQETNRRRQLLDEPSDPTIKQQWCLCRRHPPRTPGALVSWCFEWIFPKRTCLLTTFDKLSVQVISTCLASLTCLINSSLHHFAFIYNLQIPDDMYFFSRAINMQYESNVLITNFAWKCLFVGKSLLRGVCLNKACVGSSLDSLHALDKYALAPASITITLLWATWR